MLRILLLLGIVWTASAHHGNELEHKNEQQNNVAEQNQQADVQPEVIQYYPEQSHVLTSRSVVEAAPVFYYPELNTDQVFIPVEAVPEVVRVGRQASGGAARIPISFGPAVSTVGLRPVPAVQPARPVNLPFGGAANIPVSPLRSNRPIRQLPQVEDPNAGVSQPLRPPTQPARPAVNPPLFSNQPPRPIGGAAKIPITTGPFPVNRPGRDAENPPANLPQVEDPNAGLKGDAPKTPLLKPVVLGPHPVDVPSWVTKPQVEDPNAGIGIDKPKTKPFHVAGTNIGQPKPVLSESQTNDESVPIPQKLTRPFPVAGTDIGQPKPVGEFSKTKPFPVEGTNIGQPKPVFPSGRSAVDQSASAAEEPVRTAELVGGETVDSASAQKQTRPFPVEGTAVGQPKPVGEFSKTKPFPVPGSTLGQPKPVLPSVEAQSQSADLETKETAFASPQGFTRPFQVAGTNIGIPQPVGLGRPNIGRPSAVGGPFQAVTTGPFFLGRK